MRSAGARRARAARSTAPSTSTCSTRPAFAPGTGTPEAGALTSRELLAIVRGLAGLDIIAADFVELAPPYDPAGATAVAAAHVASELITLMALAAINGRG